MLSMSVSDFILTLAVGLMAMGLVSLLGGIVILVTRVIGKDIQTIADQTVKLAQKGIADDVSGLVGNASALIESLNQLVRSVAGVGVFMILLSFALLAAAYGLVIQLR